ncbi:MAG: PAS domain-containing protein [Deltaproteobacteria bacterium]
MEKKRTETLRKKAEEKVESLIRKNLAHHILNVEGKELLHELQVHMVELTLQNEQLMETQAALEKYKERYQALYDSAPACYLTLNKFGDIIEANETASSVLSVPKERMIGSPLQKFLSQSSADVFTLFLRSAMPPDETMVLDLQFQPQKDSPTFPISMSITAEFSQPNKLVGYLVVFVDPRWPRGKTR